MIRWLPVCFLLLAACEKPPAAVDPQLASEIAAIKAIDNHAHPVRPVAPGETPDAEYDALPVESLEAQSDPIRTRSGSPHFRYAGWLGQFKDNSSARSTKRLDARVRSLQFDTNV